MSFAFEKTSLISLSYKLVPVLYRDYEYGIIDGLDWFTIDHVRYIKILKRLRGFRDKLPYLVVFSLYPSFFKDLRDKRNFKKMQFCPESYGAMLEYIYIERGLFSS